jgi:hypothetical protein
MTEQSDPIDVKANAVRQAIDFAKTMKVKDLSIDDFEKLFKLIYNFYGQQCNCQGCECKTDPGSIR